MIGQNILTHKVYILSRKQPSCRFMHSLCKNENIPTRRKHRKTKKIAIRLIRIITETILVEHHGTGNVNPLRPNSDVSQTSHCDIKGLSVRKVMRIENMIIQVKFY